MRFVPVPLVLLGIVCLALACVPACGKSDDGASSEIDASVMDRDGAVDGGGETPTGAGDERAPDDVDFEDDPDAGPLNGDYADTPVGPRVPHETFITVRDGRFYDGAKRFTPVGVNYWPPYAQPYWSASKGKDWVALWGNSSFPKIDAEADFEKNFALMELRGINDIRLPMAIFPNADRSKPGPDPEQTPTVEGSYCSRLHRVLEIARKHHIFVTLVIPVDQNQWYYNPNSFDIVADDKALRSFVGYPVKFIESCKLWSEPALMAYDIDQESAIVYGKKNHDTRIVGSENGIALFNSWLVDHYGSVAAAEARFGYPLPRECAVARRGLNACPGTEDAPCATRGPRVCPPLDVEMTTDGFRPSFVKAYRTFTQWVINKRFRKITEYLRRHDPDHLITSDGILQADYCSTAFRFVERETGKYLDFVEPHQYDIQLSAFNATKAGFPNSESVKSLVRNAAYVAYLNPARRPVNFGEFGVTVKDCVGYRGPCAAADLVGVQELFYPFAMNYFARGGASGARYWWWSGVRPFGTAVATPKPGAEVSDYGVIAPGGSERPIGKQFSKGAPLIAAAEASPTTTLTVDRTSHVCLGEVMKDVLPQAQAAVEANRRLVVKTQCTDKTSVDAPLTCVDGSAYYAGCTTQPCCPLACLDAHFEKVEVETGATWTNVSSGGAITLDKGSKVRVRVTVGNLGEALWKAKATGSGSVRIQITGAGVVSTHADIPADVPSFASTSAIEFDLYSAISGDAIVSLRMEDAGRVLFGESFGLGVLVK